VGSFSAFLFFRDSGQRRQALRAEPGSAERYCLFGLDQLRDRGVAISHNLEIGREPGARARRAAALANRMVYGAGGYGGDFASPLACRGAAGEADVIFSTVDTVGLPLVLLARAGLIRRPLVYAAIGLPERLAGLRRSRVRRTYAEALATADTILAYSRHEAERIESWIADFVPPPRVDFVPFGVDTSFFRPARDGTPELDVVSVGADPRRDFPLHVQVASHRPEWRVRIVTTADRARSLGRLPANTSVETDLPFRELPERLAAARVVALPVQDNSYSGATTVLLQAMAAARPVVVSRTEAIAHGYGLADRDNCRLVEPGDARALEQAVGELLADREAAASLGARARETVERSFSWQRYADAVHDALAAAAGRARE
jgi:glycosyltransferase involved in cell wall biosynthesis